MPKEDEKQVCEAPIRRTVKKKSWVMSSKCNRLCKLAKLKSCDVGVYFLTICIGVFISQVELEFWVLKEVGLTVFFVYLKRGI